MEKEGYIERRRKKLDEIRGKYNPAPELCDTEPYRYHGMDFAEKLISMEDDGIASIIEFTDLMQGTDTVIDFSDGVYEINSSVYQNTATPADEDLRRLIADAIGLEKLATIDDSDVLPELKECTFRIACDVSNPLCGPEGCSAVFAPQKGAAPDMIPVMDSWLERYAKLAKAKYPNATPNAPGAGAAGGLGFAFLTFTNATLESGISIVMTETKLEEHITTADLVITGEGCLDGQTIMGKAPIGVAQLAKRHAKPVIAFSGCVTPDARLCNEHGIDAFFPILRQVTTMSQAMEPANARQNMIDTVEQVFRLLKASSNFG